MHAHCSEAQYRKNGIFKKVKTELIKRILDVCSPNSPLGTAGFCNSTKSPTPTAFWAATRNKYSVPCVSLLAVSSSDLVSSTFVHAFLLVGRISTMYPVMGLPPSNSGGSHLSPAVLSVHPVIDRFRGGSGLPATCTGSFLIPGS